MQPQAQSLAGRIAFVTGAGQGLGADIARALRQAGAQVAFTDVDGELAASVAAEVDGLALALDVRDEQAFSAAFATAVRHFGAVDILVNNAARTPTTSLWDVDVAEWDDVLAINLRGTFFGCRIAGRHMRERRQGRIVNIASLAGQQASTATGVHYAASKAGQFALTRAFAQELAPQGVTVNALAPAAIASPALDAMPADRQAALAAAIPVGRFGQGEEVGAAVVYLASPAAAFMTGATLDLNGGRLMR
ncbi:MAG: SDR family oxidoreductase [Variovorax sp.]|nr:MAG: SDR family oxidoreductase [Variovorax sp.]